MRISILCLASVMLAACGLARSSAVSRMDAVEIQNASDTDICNPLADSVTVTNERQRRGLGDCSDAHKRCAQLGYVPGTELYLKCRAVVDVGGGAAPAVIAVPQS